jgi:hypothetical protein
MAGYSDTPLPRKLGLREGGRVALLAAPPGYPAGLAPLPARVDLVRSLAAGPAFDVILYFARDRAELAGRFAGLAARLRPAGGLWIAWPKKASGVATDLSENVIREIGLAAGLLDNKVCAIDLTWSGLRFVYRLKDRPQERAA